MLGYLRVFILGAVTRIRSPTACQSRTWVSEFYIEALGGQRSRSCAFGFSFPLSIGLRLRLSIAGYPAGIGVDLTYYCSGTESRSDFVGWLGLGHGRQSSGWSLACGRVSLLRSGAAVVDGFDAALESRRVRSAYVA